jgi:hypothetical protein
VPQADIRSAVVELRGRVQLKSSIPPWRLRTSFMCLAFDGQNEVKTCAARRVVVGPQAAVM